MDSLTYVGLLPRTVSEALSLKDCSITNSVWRPLITTSQSDSIPYMLFWMPLLGEINNNTPRDLKITYLIMQQSKQAGKQSRILSEETCMVDT